MVNMRNNAEIPDMLHEFVYVQFGAKLRKKNEITFFYVLIYFIPRDYFLSEIATLSIIIITFAHRNEKDDFISDRTYTLMFLSGNA